MNSIDRVEPLLPGLKRYCRKLAGNDWDAEDLMQDVLAKIYRSMKTAPGRELSHAYVFRMSSDLRRRKRRSYCERPSAQ